MRVLRFIAQVTDGQTDGEPLLRGQAQGLALPTETLSVSGPRAPCAVCLSSEGTGAQKVS